MIIGLLYFYVNMSKTKLTEKMMFKSNVDCQKSGCKSRKLFNSVNYFGPLKTQVEVYDQFKMIWIISISCRKKCGRSPWVFQVLVNSTKLKTNLFCSTSMYDHAQIKKKKKKKKKNTGVPRPNLVPSTNAFMRKLSKNTNFFFIKKWEHQKWRHKNITQI